MGRKKFFFLCYYKIKKDRKYKMDCNNDNTNDNSNSNKRKDF